MGGLLVSYRLEGGLKGASATRGGTTSGYGGSGIAPWTGVSLGTLRRLEGDEDLAPRVFAMAISEKVVGGARAAWLRWGSDGRLLWFGSSLAPMGSSNDQFKTKCGIYNV